MDQITAYLINRITTNQKWIKIASYTLLVEQTIYYSNDILYSLKIDNFPFYEVSYHKHQGYLGKFTSRVIIYTKNHNSVKDLVDTVLHEIAHYIQKQTDPDFHNYDLYTKTYGSWNNRFEVEAREFASQHVDKCLLYLESKGLVKRV
ncbi:MAG: ImmA/IrrE family metallo-endopeptidase [Candidatus Delongbacteria bacterium]|nr:ImmA/IrrE family metallo-endopeptidase [Candidatus Delongbacteria bacterium]